MCNLPLPGFPINPVPNGIKRQVIPEGTENKHESPRGSAFWASMTIKVCMSLLGPSVHGSIGGAWQQIIRPIDTDALELQSDCKASAGKPLTVDNASQASEITHLRADHQSLIQISRALGHYTYSQRAHVLRRGAFSGRRVQDAGNLHRDRQPNPLLKSSRARRHSSNNLPNRVQLSGAGLDSTEKFPKSSTTLEKKTL
jgi:hypothetical protein